MIFGFVIWSVVFLALLGIGIWAWKSDKAVGFYTGTKPPEVTDVRKYTLFWTFGKSQAGLLHLDVAGAWALRRAHALAY